MTECAYRFCSNEIVPARTGRPKKFCSDQCRLSEHRAGKRDQAPVDVRTTLDRETYDALRIYALALGMNTWQLPDLVARIVERELRREDILAIVQPRLTATEG